MKQHAGEVLPSPSLGTWTATAGGSYQHVLVNRSALVASWAKVNGGNLNVMVTAIGSNAERHMTSTFRTAASAATVELAAPLLGATGHWSRPVPFAHPDDLLPYNCGYTTGNTMGGTGRIGQLAIWNDENGSFTYGKTADTEAGVSFTDGSTGEIHISNSQKHSYSETYRGDTFNYILSDFASGQYTRDPPPSGKFYCDDPTGSTHPYQWEGAIHEGNRITGPNLEDACPETLVTKQSINDGKNSKFRTGSATAGGWSVGLTAFGVGLSMDSGYSTDVEFLINTLSASKNHWMCGRTTVPDYAPDVWTGPNS
jgi:hypothetical protein